MSSRQSRPSRQSRAELELPSSHYFITLARGNRIRTISVRPAVLLGIGGLLSLLGIWYFVATLYFVFRDEVLAALVRGEAQTQYAYEDRLADLRTQLDKTTSRQLLDQSALESRIGSLLSRQAQLELRAGVVAGLSEQLGRLGEADVAVAAPQFDGRRGGTSTVADRSVESLFVNPIRTAPGRDAPPGAVQAAPQIAPTAKPHPDDAAASVSSRVSEADGVSKPAASAVASAAADRRMPLPVRLGIVAEALGRVELAQFRSLAVLGRRARASAAQLELALATAGLNELRFGREPAGPAARGGPFVPLGDGAEANAFEREVVGLQQAVASAGRLRRIMPYVPLRQPFPTGAEMTSGFGGRIDPFNGRIAMHTGVDFGSSYGASVRSTAAGRVRFAGVEGGYGNMVELDHGHGLATRYGHLSRVLVTPGQQLEAGDIVGEVGSTGRSTGPHLHYETRIDGEPVDPARFLRAGHQLFAVP